MTMPGFCGRKRRISSLPLLLCIFIGLHPATAGAQNAAYFSPTYAASEGSPYSDIYARTFGAGGPPIETSAPPPVTLPPVALPPVAAAPPLPQADGGTGEALVYVIENGRLLTFRAADYASGSGEALVRTPLPPADPAHDFSAPQGRVPTIADRLYGTAPLETAAGPPEAPAPIRLIPPEN